MPITADLGGKNYTLGRGRVFFDRFAPNVVVGATTRGEGERYIGNTPEFTLTSESEELDHYDSDAGVRVKDASVQLSLDRSGSFTADSIDRENLALFFLGDAATLTQSSATGQIENLTVKRGMFYQLGVTPSNPSGVRKVTVTLITDDAGTPVTIAASGNYEVDEDRGRIYILPAAAAIADGDIIIVTYNVAASTREQVVSKTQSIYGAIRFVANNPKGPNRDYYFPYVKLSPDGDYNLKGDEWQQMGFTMEILKKSSNVESTYIDGQAA